MNKKTRNIALTIIILAGGISLGYIWSNYGFSPDVKEVPLLTEKNSGQILLDGKIVSEKSADLGFIIPATIKTIAKKVGDEVKTGEILATQDSADLQAQLSSTQASLVGAQAGLDKANHDLKQEKLKIHGLSSNARKQQQAQISSSQDSVAVQENVIVSAQAGVANAKAQLAKTILKAPFDGIITRQDGEVGEVGGVSAPSFMTIASKEPLRKIEAFASDLDLAKLKVGDNAQVAFDVLSSQKTMTAKIISIDPQATNVQGKAVYKVTLMLDEIDTTIRVGMHASIVLGK